MFAVGSDQMVNQDLDQNSGTTLRGPPVCIRPIIIPIINFDNSQLAGP